MSNTRVLDNCVLSCCCLYFCAPSHDHPCTRRASLPQNLRAPKEAVRQKHVFQWDVDASKITPGGSFLGCDFHKGENGICGFSGTGRPAVSRTRMTTSAMAVVCQVHVDSSRLYVILGKSSCRKQSSQICNFARLHGISNGKVWRMAK